MAYFRSRIRPRCNSFCMTFLYCTLPLVSGRVASTYPLLNSGKIRTLAFGDYSEVPETCPVITSCPVICVQSEEKCPTSCPSGMELCFDGNCAEVCDEKVENPCGCEPLTFACAKTVLYYESCFETFQKYYDATNACEESPSEEMSFSTPSIFIFYFWIACLTIAVFLWCYFNQKVFPVENSSQSLEPTKKNANEKWVQTGYKSDIIGSIIYFFVQLTLIGIHVFLFTLTLVYYMQQGAVTRWVPVTQDDAQILLMFEIVWMIGLPWSFIFYYPDSLHSVFLRRCTLDKANYVAVEAPITSVVVKSTPRFVQKFTKAKWALIHLFLRTFFSYSSSQGTSIQFCKVDDDKYDRSFYHRMRRYVYHAERACFISGHINVCGTIGDLLTQMRGLTTEKVTIHGGTVGHNAIHIQEPSMYSSIKKEFTKPFYVYQAFMTWTWAPYWYYYMAIVNTVVRIASGVAAGLAQYISDSTIHQLSMVDGNVVVFRDAEFFEVSVKDVVPGDVVVIKPGVVHFDLAILKGNRIKVDESALSGETTPIIKEPMNPFRKDEIYCPLIHKANTIFAGTKVIDVCATKKELGLVLTIGSFTTKGELLCDVLSYERHRMAVDDEVSVVLLILFLQSVVLLALVFYFLQGQWVYAWFYGMFVVGTIFPPLLPSVFVVSVAISVKRLQQKRICCMHAERILVAGKVDTAFFDKTGTITNEEMEFFNIEINPHGDKQLNLALIQIGMAVCHTIHVSTYGQKVGNCIDLMSFECTSASLIQRNGEMPEVQFERQVYKTLRRFEFDSELATQSVIVGTRAGRRLVFVKGSADTIKYLSCKSTLPDSYDDIVRNAEVAGIYQLAMAYKELTYENDIEGLDRSDVEKELTFCGFIQFQNAIKDEAPSVLRELKDGNIDISILTGDSVLTALAVARKCGLIAPNNTVLVGMKSDDLVLWKDVYSDEIIEAEVFESLCKSEGNAVLAITGEAWTFLQKESPNKIHSIASHIRVFGRCKPGDKVSIVSYFVEYGRTTLMCGDGQNDCGALKMAHVGISLSTSEASVVSAFTSLDRKIAAVPEILREGRCALASAFASYKYYITYGQVEAFLQVINAYLGITFAEWCWVFLDGLWSISMAYSLSLSKASKKLSKFCPTASLLSSRTLFSVCGILFINFSFIVIAFMVLFNQEWFQCRKWNVKDVSNILIIGDNYESSVLFLVGGYQYISSAIALNFGYSHRQSWWSNYKFVFLAALWTAFVFMMTIYPSRFSCIWRVNCSNENVVRGVTQNSAFPINNYWNTTVMPVIFRWHLVLIITINLLTLMAWEYFVVNGYLVRKVQKKKKSRILN